MATIVKTEKYDSNTGELFSVSTKKEIAWINEDGFLYINKACCHLLGKEVLPLSLGNEAIVAFYYFINIHLGYENILLVKENKTIRYATIEDLSNTLKCSKRQLYRKIKPLFDNNVMIKCYDANSLTYFAINPIYALFGHRITFRTYMDFKDILSNYLSGWTKTRIESIIYNKEKVIED